MKSLLRSRRGVVLVTLGVLLLLDAGRSAHARIGYAQPVQTWQPDPAVYADLAWPPGADLPASTPESTAMARDLKRRGFRFVGPTTAYALMQAAGLVDDHLVDCLARGKGV